MARKFFGTVFKRRKPVIPERESTVSDLTPIKPARDITDFEYPPGNEAELTALCGD